MPMKALYIAWQDPDTRCWHTVGRLSRDQKDYQFAYTRGALASPRFGYLGRMHDTAKVYRSQDLFPLFANRLLSESRPEYSDYLSWMAVDSSADKFELLARSGGRRGTDQLCVYPEVEPNGHGEMEIHFFSHGLRYLSPEELATVASLQPGNPLQLTTDGNPHDSYALLLEARKPPIKVGYCPRYLNQGLAVAQAQAPIRLTVEKANLDAPLKFRLLCKAVFVPAAGFELYSSDEHQPLSAEAMAA